MSEPAQAVDRRIARTRQRVLEAAQRLLFDGGPTALTYSAISKEAGVGRTTLYRHWPTIDDLWNDISSATSHQAGFEPSGDLRRDLLSAMRIVEEMARTEAGRLNVASMLERSQWDDETYRFATRFHDQTPVYQALERGRGFGAVPDSENLRVATNLLVGPLILEALFTRGDFDDSLVERIVDHYLDSIAGQEHR